MGCIKFIVNIVIVVLVIIGIKAVVGDEFFNEKLNPFHPKPQQEKLEKAKKIANFDDLSANYEIDKTAEMLGYKMILAEHKKSGQKLALIDQGLTPVLSKKDFKDGAAEKKIYDLNKKLQYQYIHLEDFKITQRGEFKAMGQSIPYMRFKANTVNLPIASVSGFVAAAKNDKGKEIIIASVNEQAKYSQPVSEEFFKKFK